MVKDDGYWVNVAYIAGFLILFYVYYQLLQSVGLTTGWLERYSSWYNIVSTLGGAVLSALSVWAYVKPAARREHHRHVIAELRKVTWPSAANTKKMTWVVVIVVAIFSVILGAFDFVWSWLLQQILMI